MTSGRLGASMGGLDRLLKEGCRASWGDDRLIERFRLDRDEEAFALLVQRHGPLVKGVAARMLSEPADLDDVFQSVFMVLAMKVDSLESGGALGSWLYRVTVRLSAHANTQSIRRASAIRTLAAERSTAATSRENRENEIALLSELERLPEKFRAPIVLHYFERLSYQEIQANLGWSEGMVRNRLARGKQLLRLRLTQQGVAVAGTILVQSLMSLPVKAASAPTDRALARLASLAASGGSHWARSAGAATIARLVQHGLAGSAIGMKLKAAGAAILILGCVVAAAQGFSKPTPGLQDAPAMKKDMKRNAGEVRGDGNSTRQKLQDALIGEEVQTSVSGSVVDGSGKPVVGASVTYQCADPLNIGREFPTRSAPVATTDAKGTFRFLVRARDLAPGRPADPRPVVAASAPGLAIGWTSLGVNADPAQVTIRLAPDNAVEGTVIDLEGRPIAGVSVRPLAILTGADGTLGELDKARAALKERLAGAKPFHPLYGDKTPHEMLSSKVDRESLAGIPDATTDANGRFRIAGIGKDRLVWLRIEGPNIAIEARHFAMTAAGEKFLCPVNFDNYYVDHYKYYPSGFTFVAAAAKTVSGTLRDEKTREPVAGARVTAIFDYDQAPTRGLLSLTSVTDETGFYKLAGLPLNAPYQEVRLEAEGARGSSYLPIEAAIPQRPGEAKTTLDITMYRGARIIGKAVDVETGKPIAGFVHYFMTNLSKNRVRTRYGTLSTVADRRDGSFELVVPTGYGTLSFRAMDARYNGYQQLGDDMRDPKATASNVKFRFEPNPNLVVADEATYGLNLGDDERERSITIKLEAGKERRLKAVLPGGAPPARMWVRGAANFKSLYAAPVVTEGNAVVASMVTKATPRSVMIHDEMQSFGAIVRLPLEDPAENVVTLAACGQVRGRLVDPSGKPIAGKPLHGGLDDGLNLKGFGEGLSLAQNTDADGRFLAKGLIPGRAYSLYLFDEENQTAGLMIFEARTVKPGENVDLGDVKADEN